MSDKEKQELRSKILELENYVKETKQNIAKAEENIKQCEKAIRALKDIAWDRESKKESNKMYKVLENEKPSTIVKSNVGNVIVDKEFMEKEKSKHLDNPHLRGMISTEEMLSFPKVAKNVKPEYNKLYKSYTWRAKADDESILRYGSREYEINGKDTNRLLTNYSETEYGERQDRGEQGQPHHLINDLNFLRPANDIIAKNENEVSPSAMKRVKQRIEEVTKGKDSKNHKSTESKNKGISR